MNKQNLELLKNEEINFHLLNIIDDPIIITNGKEIIYKNNAYDKLLKKLEILKSFNFLDLKDIIYHKNSPLNNIELEAFLNQELEVYIHQLNNKKLTFNLKVTYLEKNQLFLVYLNDITLLIEHEEDKHRLLYTDNLTKLPNRLKLVEDLKIGLLNVQSLAILDINSFKEINDFFGNKIGDEILIGVGQIVEKLIKEYKNLILYKFPADTYCVVNLDKNQDKFLEIIKNIIFDIDKKIFYLENNEINTRIKAGISFSEKNNKLITADLALQAAKKDSKDYLVFYDKLDNLQEYQNNIQWSKKIKNALENDKIVVYFQPLINNETMKVEKYECLVRMIDEDKVISPYFFLDISKKSNQYKQITKVVIKKSCQIFSDLEQEFSVNISYDDIIEPDFLDFIKSMYSKYNVKNKIVFEILEDQSIKDYTILTNFIDEVKKLGCKVAIDDFGSGYSNFEHLLKMKIDYLKIDASLIKNIANDSNSYKVTKTVIDFANSLNLKTIAEFVENKEIFEIVKNLGSTYSQGYYFSEPLVMPTYK